MKQTLVIATSNPGKVKEFLHILGEEHFEFKTLSEVGFIGEIVEDAPTFRGNAEIKARAVAEYVFDRFPDYAVLADDSGLEVSALGGAPGVFTARYAGVGATDEQNYRKLLSELKCHADRSARFVCCLCYLRLGCEPLFFDGDCPGRILEEPVGDQGFGYDPVFSPEPGERSFAQMSHSDKKALSHRGAAIRKMHEFLDSIPKY